MDSIVVIESLINLIIRNGARAANKGEFTYSSLIINRRIGISEAEAAADDSIDSNNKLMAEASVYKMSRKINKRDRQIKRKYKKLSYVSLWRD